MQLLSNLARPKVLTNMPLIPVVMRRLHSHSRWRLLINRRPMFLPVILRVRPRLLSATCTNINRECLLHARVSYVHRIHGYTCDTCYWRTTRKFDECSNQQHDSTLGQAYTHPSRTSGTYVSLGPCNRICGHCSYLSFTYRTL